MNNLLDSIPTAKAAYEQYSKMQDERTEAEIARVVVALTQAIEQGKRCVTVEPINSLLLVQELKQKGYGVSTRQTGPNESGTEISW